MTIEALVQDDVQHVGALTPEGWSNTQGFIQYHVNASFCTPMKAVVDGKMIGLGSAAYYGDSVWLSAIIVHPDYRNRGIGLAITKTLVDSVDRKRYPTILLDATEYGQPVYKKLGFEVFSEHAHFTGGLWQEEAIPGIHPFEEKYTEQVLVLDKNATGEDRQALLLPNMTGAQVYLVGNEVQGVYIPALSKGAIIAATGEAGIALMKYRLQTKNECMLPVENTTGIAFLQNNGYTYTKRSPRMRLGPAREWQPSYIYNVVSGGYG